MIQGQYPREDILKTNNPYIMIFCRLHQGYPSSRQLTNSQLEMVHHGVTESTEIAQSVFQKTM